MINEHEQDEFLKKFFKNLPEEKPPVSFVADTMKRIERETTKSKAKKWVLIISGAVLAVLAAVFAGIRFLPGSTFVQYVDSVFNSIKQSFKFDVDIVMPSSASGLSLMIGVVVLILLFADLIFDRPKKQKTIVD